MTVHTRVMIEYGDPNDPTRTLPAVPMCFEHGPECPITLVWRRESEYARIDRVSERAWDEADDWGKRP
jgi:hypothetical protein